MPKATVQGGPGTSGPDGVCMQQGQSALGGCTAGTAVAVHDVLCRASTPQQAAQHAMQGQRIRVHASWQSEQSVLRTASCPQHSSKQVWTQQQHQSTQQHWHTGTGAAGTGLAGELAGELTGMGLMVGLGAGEEGADTPPVGGASTTGALGDTAAGAVLTGGGLGGKGGLGADSIAPEEPCSHRGGLHTKPSAACARAAHARPGESKLCAQLLHAVAAASCREQGRAGRNGRRRGSQDWRRREGKGRQRRCRAYWGCWRVVVGG